MKGRNRNGGCGSEAGEGRTFRHAALTQIAQTARPDSPCRRGFRGTDSSLPPRSPPETVAALGQLLDGEFTSITYDNPGAHIEPAPRASRGYARITTTHDDATYVSRRVLSGFPRRSTPRTARTLAARVVEGRAVGACAGAGESAGACACGGGSGSACGGESAREGGSAGVGGSGSACGSGSGSDSDPPPLTEDTSPHRARGTSPALPASSSTSPPRRSSRSPRRSPRRS
jgi:hypothetical protein